MFLTKQLNILMQGVKGDPIPASSEEEICELLQVEYTPPHDRSL
jgi:DNA polymerase/3'-5' exonuclease PolX